MTGPLADRARQGDEVALRALYEAHRGPILRLAYAILGDRDEAEDVMQDVMIYALTHMDRYDPDRGSFGTWVHAITVSRCRDRLRRAKVRLRNLTAAWRSTEALSADPEEGLLRLDATRRIAPALAQLTARQREAIALRDIEDLSLQEMADILGVPLRTAQARLHSAHAALRRILAAESPSAGSSAGNREYGSDGTGKTILPDGLVQEADGG